MAIRTNTGMRNMKVKKRIENATVYSSRYWRPFLLATSVKDSNSAVNQANINQNMVKIMLKLE
ncbi:hypothetical protein GCM10025860_24220 [Methanobacterium ferruginis]|nr:hypothetical protein GCM10025860_24220 [Methanobacterium ferruginis]